MKNPSQPKPIYPVGYTYGYPRYPNINNPQPLQPSRARPKKSKFRFSWNGRISAETVIIFPTWILGMKNPSQPKPTYPMGYTCGYRRYQILEPFRIVKQLKNWKIVSAETVETYCFFWNAPFQLKRKFDFFAIAPLKGLRIIYVWVSRVPVGIFHRVQWFWQWWVLHA